MREFSEAELVAETKQEKIKVILRLGGYDYPIHGKWHVHAPLPEITRGVAAYRYGIQEYERAEEKMQQSLHHHDELAVLSEKLLDDQYQKALDLYISNWNEFKSEEHRKSLAREVAKKRIGGLLSEGYKSDKNAVRAEYQALRATLSHISDQYAAETIKAAERSQEALKEALKSIRRLDRNLNPLKFPSTWQNTLNFINAVCPALRLPQKKGFHAQIKQAEKNGATICLFDLNSTDNAWSQVFGEIQKEDRP